jgi:hypothetical protein
MTSSKIGQEDTNRRFPAISNSIDWKASTNERFTLLFSCTMINGMKHTINVPTNPTTRFKNAGLNFKDSI